MRLFLRAFFNIEFHALEGCKWKRALVEYVMSLEMGQANKSKGFLDQKEKREGTISGSSGIDLFIAMCPLFCQMMLILH